MATAETIVLNVLLSRPQIGTALCILSAGVLRLINFGNIATASVAFITATVSGALAVASALPVIRNGEGAPLAITILNSPALSLKFHIDGLSALFLILFSIIVPLSFLYSIEYAKGLREPLCKKFYSNLLLLTASIPPLLTATDMFLFLFIIWQVMTWSGYALIKNGESEYKNNLAGFKYLIMMQIALTSVLAGTYLVVAPYSGNLNEFIARGDFDAMLKKFGDLLTENPLRANIALCLFAIGFGIKAGVLPFGLIWIPGAYSSSLTPASAIFAGILSNTGFYGLIRIFFCMTPPASANNFPAYQWGVSLALIGTLMLALCAFIAVRQDAAKRLLAFSSLSQYGYILLAIGTALALCSINNQTAINIASICLVAALLHIFNHAFLKAILFYNAGSFIYFAGTDNLNRLRGLISIMPVSAIAAFIAVLSISGFPPFNGFFSKWLIYTSSLNGGSFIKPFYIFGLIAILSSVLTLAMYLKYFGSAYLSRADNTPDQNIIGNKIPVSLIVPQVILSILSVALGLFPDLLTAVVTTCLKNTHQGVIPLLSNSFNIEFTPISAVLPATSSVYYPAGIALLIGISGIFAFILSALCSPKKRRTQQWLCGYVADVKNTHYTARNFYGVIRNFNRKRQNL